MQESKPQPALTKSERRREKIKAEKKERQKARREKGMVMSPKRMKKLFEEGQKLDISLQMSEATRTVRGFSGKHLKRGQSIKASTAQKANHSESTTVVELKAECDPEVKQKVAEGWIYVKNKQE